MTGHVEALAWDTEFFGIPIGRVNLDQVTVSELDAVDEEARAAGITCLYASLNPDDRLLAYQVQEHGYRFVESAIMMSIDPERPIPANETRSTVRFGTLEDLDEIEEHIALMAPWSRYAMDPRFGVEASRRLHLAWVRRAATCTTDEFNFYIAEEDGEITAFMTMTNKAEPLIDTVGTTRPGSGASRLLIANVRRQAPGKRVFAGTSASRHVAVQKWLINCGLRPHSVQYMYHRWLDDEGVSS